MAKPKPISPQPRDMATMYIFPTSKHSVLIPIISVRTQTPCTPTSQISFFSSPSPPTQISSSTHSNPLTKPINKDKRADTEISAIPTMSEIMDASKSQNIDIKLQTLGPFFRITAMSLETKREIGRAEGLVRVWLGGKILHLDSIRLGRETLSMEKSIFGIGLFVGAVAIRHGFDCGCRTAELLAINDTDLYHTKLVRFYTRIGFKAVHEVDGSSAGDFMHMLVWGGKGTRMDGNVEELLIKWCRRFKARKSLSSSHTKQSNKPDIAAMNYQDS